jgi:GNAT superfamily N-acetyltransferase
VLNPLSPALPPASSELEHLESAHLSARFDPFLPYFAKEARRCGGEVRLAREDGSIVGVLVSDPVERIASVFCHSRSVAERFVRERGVYGTFSEFLLEPRSELFRVYSLRPDGRLPTYRFRHEIRPVLEDDLPSILDLMREVNGVVNARWFEGLSDVPETGFLAEVEGRPAGVGWVSVIGAHARLHSLSVRAPFRRLGVGTDILRARILWAQRSGASEIVSEIWERNFVSQRIATQAGMQRVGEMYFYPPVR